MGDQTFSTTNFCKYSWWSTGTGAWVTPYVIDPNNSATLFAGMIKFGKQQIEEITGQALLNS